MKPWSLVRQLGRTAGLASAGLLFALVGPAQAQTSASQTSVGRAPAPRPVVVELFTAQGCSGCPEANRLLEDLQQDAEVISLTYGVGYWDYLGWSDTFARPEFADRQRAYRQALHLRNVATPQLIIDGRTQVSGNRAPELKAAIETLGDQDLPPPEIEFRQGGERVGIGSGRVPSGGAEVVAVIFKPGIQTVVVNRGDNQGQRVRHLNVVREVHRLGPWRGRPALYDLPARKASEDNVVVLVQSQINRHILTAALATEPQRD